MAKNIIYKPGQHLPAPVTAGTTSGTPVRLGGLNAITITDRAKTDVAPISANGTVNTAYNAGGGNANGNASVHFEGVVKAIVTAATAPTFGQVVYLASTGLTTTAATPDPDPVWGHAVDLAPVDLTDGTFVTLVRISN